VDETQQCNLRKTVNAGRIGVESGEKVLTFSHRERAGFIRVPTLSRSMQIRADPVATDSAPSLKYYK
jgi:hypothetical protein